jgi:hypothetical protein
MQDLPMNEPAQAGDTDEDTRVPCPSALVAGTLALMTAWADAGTGPASAELRHRGLLARKIVSNLFFLRHHPALHENVRRVAGNAHERWLPMAGALDALPSEAAALLAMPAGPACH